MKEKVKAPEINKIDFNNFITSLQPVIKKAICSTRKKLSLKFVKLKKKNLKEASRREVSLEEAFLKGKKLEKFKKQLRALKSFSCLDIVKFVVLVKKPLLDVLRDKSASVEQKALTHVAYEKAVQEKIQDFRSKYPNWAREAPSIAKKLGRNLKRRLKKLKTSDNDIKASEIVKSSEESRKKLLTLLNEIDPEENSLSKRNRKGLSSVEEKTKKQKIDKVNGQVKKRAATEESNKKIKKKRVEVKDNDKVEEVLQINNKNLKSKSKLIKQKEKSSISVSKKENSKFNNELKIKKNKNRQEEVTNPSNNKKIKKLSKKADNYNEPSTLTSKNETIKKLNRLTSKASILELNKIGKEKKGSEEKLKSKFGNVEKRKCYSSKSEEEEFLKNGSVTEKKKSSSSSFNGRMENTNIDGGNDLEVSDVENHSQARRELKPMLKNRKRKVLNEEDNELDFSKLKKKNSFTVTICVMRLVIKNLVVELAVEEDLVVGARFEREEE